MLHFSVTLRWKRCGRINLLVESKIEKSRALALQHAKRYFFVLCCTGVDLPAELDHACRPRSIAEQTRPAAAMWDACVFSVGLLLGFAVPRIFAQDVLHVAIVFLTDVLHQICIRH